MYTIIVNCFTFSIVLMTVDKIDYNPSLHNLIEWPRNDKSHQQLWTYIQKHLRKYMDENWVKEVISILDDPLREYNDEASIREALQKILPKVKEALKIDDANPLKKMINTRLLDKDLSERLIKQRLKLYREMTSKWWMLTKVFQYWVEQRDHIDMKEPEARANTELKVDNVDQTGKTIIANILTLMILWEELGKEPGKKAKKVRLS